MLPQHLQSTRHQKQTKGAKKAKEAAAAAAEEEGKDEGSSSGAAALPACPLCCNPLSRAETAAVTHILAKEPPRKYKAPGTSITLTLGSSASPSPSPSASQPSGSSSEAEAKEDTVAWQDLIPVPLRTPGSLTQVVPHTLAFFLCYGCRQILEGFNLVTDGAVEEAAAAELDALLDKAGVPQGCMTAEGRRTLASELTQFPALLKPGIVQLIRRVAASSPH